VLTLRAAAALLAQADSLIALRAIARLLGFHAITPLAADSRRDLTIEPLVSRADLARGPGRLRCLSAHLAEADALADGSDPRELTRQLALTISRRAPSRDWCVLTLDASTQIICIAVLSPQASTERTFAVRITALRVDRRRIVDSDAETLRSLASVSELEPALRHARFADIVGRDALSTRFYRALYHTVEQLADSATGPATRLERRELALLNASRCLFLAFLEAKGWLNHDRNFLLHQLTARLERGGALHERLLRPLFFGTLNTPLTQRSTAARAFGEIPFLNGGLFAPTPLEQRSRSTRFSDDAITALIGDLLDRYRFTAHEDSTRWSEAAIDPEMLGRAFEALMAADERHRSGSYYTPPALVESVVHDALRAALPGLPASALTDDRAPLTLDAPGRAALAQIRVLDPACGSGAFLVHMLESLARLHQRAGDPRPLHTLRRELLVRSIFGVDRNPMAVWLCELRLWLSIVIESPDTTIAHITPLPNLDHHIRLGDTLAGGDFRFAPPSARRLSALRQRYTRAVGARKHTLARLLDREERTRAIAACARASDEARRERAAVIESLRRRDLFGERRIRTRADTAALTQSRLRMRELTAQRAKLERGAALPFRFAAHFADVAAEGGFALVIGNPPWVRPHAIPQAERVRMRLEYRSMRHPAWHAGAQRAGAGAGFAAQADLSAAFVERSVQLLAPNGVAALLVPAKLWRALAGGGLRRFLTDHVHLRTLRDWSESPALFDAAVYPSLVVGQRAPANAATPVAPAISPANPTEPHEVPVHRRTAIRVSVTHRTRTREFSVQPSRLSLDGDPTAPWLLIPRPVRSALEYLRTAGPALGDSAIGRPTLGVKCGCNAAFLVHAQEHDDELASVVADNRRALIERRLLRPVLRGEDVHDAAPPMRARTTPALGDPRIIWTHDSAGAPLRVLPPATARWLAHWRSTLERRRDARARLPWWSVFRTDAARSESPRVVWADIGRRLDPRILDPGDPTVPLNSCYVLRTASLDDAWAVSALLASPVASAWFAVLAEPARGGFRRYMGWTVATLPIPAEWNRMRAPLAALGRTRHTSPLSADEYLERIAEAYGLSARLLRPLASWSSHP
jgi:hypothetical protein